MVMPTRENYTRAIDIRRQQSKRHQQPRANRGLIILSDGGLLIEIYFSPVFTFPAAK